MLDVLISSKTRVKILIKFFLNPNSKAYLRGLAQEFGESTNAIRMELNRFEEADLINGEIQGNKKYFAANTKHPIYKDIHNLLLKYVGVDEIVNNLIGNLGELKKLYLVGEFAEGKDSKIIDLIFVGDIDKEYLIKLIDKAEQHVNRKIRFLIVDNLDIKDNLIDNMGVEKYILIWEND